MKKSSKIREVDQNIIDEEMARIIPGKINYSSTEQSLRSSDSPKRNDSEGILVNRKV